MISGTPTTVTVQWSMCITTFIVYYYKRQTDYHAIILLSLLDHRHLNLYFFFYPCKTIRSDYLSLSGLRAEYPNTPLLALTATANQSVVQDCIRLIGMRDPYRHTLSFNRCDNNEICGDCVDTVEGGVMMS
jgi:hypothetical protein